jgi:hypothetical protein
MIDAILTLVVLPLPPLPDSTQSLADTTARPPRIVRRFHEIVVRASHLHDPRSSETVHLISPAARSFPADRLQELLALQPGVVAQGEALHVRGGRAGEFKVLLDGVELNEPLRDRPMEIPLVATRAAELVSGGLDAEYGGALAGVLNVRTFDPSKRFEGELAWSTDGRRETEYDRVAGRSSGPLGVMGLGWVAGAEATLDGTYLPSLRSRPRHRMLGGQFGWRDDNRLLGYAKIAPLGTPGASLQALANRHVSRPYDPMWSVDAWINFCPGVDSICPHPDIRPDPQPGYTHYRAADHKTITDERRIATILALATPPSEWRATGSLAWLHSRSITSLDGRDDFSYIVDDRRPIFGDADSPDTDPFFVYQGDEPYFRRSSSDVTTARADLERRTARGNGIKLGLGATYQSVSLWEFDDGFARFSGIDTVRAYRADAPGGFAYLQGRWEFQGLTLNTGLRAQYFDPGAQRGRTPWPVPQRAIWTLAPRLGLSYPVSVRDAFSLSYARIHQDPARDFLYDSRLAPFNRHPLGNPQLEPSTVVSWQAALKHLFERQWSLQLGVFYRDLFGQIGLRNDAPPRLFRPRYTNQDEGHASGFELTALKLWGEESRLELHYTYLYAWGTQSREEGVPFGTVLADRTLPIAEHPLDWDRRHSLSLAGTWNPVAGWSLSWSTLLGSALPWTPRERRAIEADQSRENSRRLSWSENSSLAVRFRPHFFKVLSLGLEVRNLFDWRGDLLTTVDGYPHPIINTTFDDYSAYRNETGRGGGAYWDDVDGDGKPGWVPVHDLRLSNAPRMIRASIRAEW